MLDLPKQALVAPIITMGEINLCKIQSDGTGNYDTSFIHGDILVRVQCADGIVLLVRLIDGAFEK